jgi:hypothetical protein
MNPAGNAVEVSACGLSGQYAPARHTLCNRRIIAAAPLGLPSRDAA